jgi:O-antigen ligase
MALMNLLAIIALLSFIMIMAFSKNIRRTYLLISIFTFPLIDIPVTPAALGSLRVFDIYSYLTFFILFKDFVKVAQEDNKTYRALFLIFILFLVIGSLASEFIGRSLLEILSIFPIFIFGKLLIDECMSFEGFDRQLIFFLKLVGIFSIGMLFAQMYVGLNLTFYATLNPNSSGPDGFRYPSFFQDPQKYAQFLAMISFLFLINTQSRHISYKNIGLFALCILSLLFTGGRSALIGLAGGMFVLLLFLDTNAKVGILAGLLLCSLPIIYFSDMFVTFNRLSDFDNDYEFRNSIWKEAFQIFTNHPFFGIGGGNYQRFIEYYSYDQYFIYENEIEYFDQPENGYLKILVEYGLLGFGVFALFFLLPIVKGIKSFLNGEASSDNRFFIASIVSWIIAFNSVYSVSDRRIMLTLVCLLSFLIASGSRTLKNEV